MFVFICSSTHWKVHWKVKLRTAGFQWAFWWRKPALTLASKHSSVTLSGSFTIARSCIRVRNHLTNESSIHRQWHSNGKWAHTIRQTHERLDFMCLWFIFDTLMCVSFQMTTIKRKRRAYCSLSSLKRWKVWRNASIVFRTPWLIRRNGS